MRPQLPTSPIRPASFGWHLTFGAHVEGLREPRPAPSGIRSVRAGGLNSYDITVRACQPDPISDCLVSLFGDCEGADRAEFYVGQAPARLLAEVALNTQVG